jgi:pimeloyl-ACP methyl ester carboxylesterase
LTEAFTVHSGGARLHCEKAGKGACVIMLHAGIADARMWRPTQDYLVRNHMAVAYDRRGYGETTTPDEPFSHIDDLERIRTVLGVERVSLIGCSQGGRVAIDYALAHRQRVASLVLVASAVSGAPSPQRHSAEIAALLAKLDAAEEAGDLARVNEIEAHLWLDGPSSREGRIAGAVRELFLDMNGKALRHPQLTRERESPSAVDRLADITTPTLVIWGDLDFPHVQERSQMIAANISGTQSAIMRDSAHLPNLEQPGRFNKIVGEFLRYQ